jgi:tRNA-uridine 2-sulfurtransferase
MHPTTAIALSGGIDSLVAAALLKEQGHRLIGLHFLTGYETTGINATDKQSAKDLRPFDPTAQIREQLVSMTEQLDIPIHIIDLCREFKSAVVDYFTTTYRLGRTPNPCLVCNPLIKYDILYKKAQALGAGAIATGHYARIHPGFDGRMHLLRGLDPVKEQSYFLARLTQLQFSRAILPLGNLTKNQTRRIALQKGLLPAAPQESQDICFIKNGKYGDFLARQPGFAGRSGEIEELNGRIVGRHQGLHLFTVGQRRGINCPAKEPYYVHHLDMARNCLVICFKKDLQVPACQVGDINWILPCPREPLQVAVQLRYRHSAVAATLTPLAAHRADIEFETPQEAVTPGQGAVFYQGDEVVGGGWIE